MMNSAGWKGKKLHGTSAGIVAFTSFVPGQTRLFGLAIDSDGILLIFRAFCY